MQYKSLTVPYSAWHLQRNPKHRQTFELVEQPAPPYSIPPLFSPGLLEQRALSSAAETLENDSEVCAEAVRHNLCPVDT